MNMIFAHTFQFSIQTLLTLCVTALHLCQTVQHPCFTWKNMDYSTTIPVQNLDFVDTVCHSSAPLPNSSTTRFNMENIDYSTTIPVQH